MLNKLVNVLKEVFWIKTSPKKRFSRKITVKKKKVVRKAVTKKTVVKKAVKSAKPKKNALDPSLKPVGEITHYFDRIKVCVVKITQGTVLIGDRLTVATASSHFVQKVWSMQIESTDVKVAKKGQLIGIKIDKPVESGDIVYK